MMLQAQAFSIPARPFALPQSFACAAIWLLIDNRSINQSINKSNTQTLAPQNVLSHRNVHRSQQQRTFCSKGRSLLDFVAALMGCSPPEAALRGGGRGARALLVSPLGRRPASGLPSWLAGLLAAELAGWLAGIAMR
mmetsp:Transcript_6718/g.11801  ORF Transcript_6718/g.11801 Transcript_6718/m.11801 type:complete len:137 (-) Transcript_6718:218-628(-)